jgi:uncharacterized protein (DUF427 family)
MTDMSRKPNPAPAFQSHPGYRIELLDCPKRLRATFDGATVFDTLDAVLLRETDHLPVYYVPRGDADTGLMTRTDHGTHCPFKGDASYFSLRHGDRVAENAVWTYETPFDECLPVKDYLAFYWNELDQWYEEDEEVFVHARDPRVRIDVLASSRPVMVEAGGETIAETTRALFLFETGHPVRYYIPREDVRQDLLRGSAKRTGCPYKGWASYHHLEVGGKTIEDAVWFYPQAHDEVRRVAGYLCFYPEKVDRITVGRQGS